MAYHFTDTAQIEELMAWEDAPAMVYTVHYLSPYSCQWCYQSFNSMEEAVSRRDFYLSCGSLTKAIDIRPAEPELDLFDELFG